METRRPRAVIFLSTTGVTMKIRRCTLAILVACMFLAGTNQAQAWGPWGPRGGWGGPAGGGGFGGFGGGFGGGGFGGFGYGFSYGMSYFYFVRVRNRVSRRVQIGRGTG